MYICTYEADPGEEPEMEAGFSRFQRIKQVWSDRVLFIGVVEGYF